MIKVGNLESAIEYLRSKGWTEAAHLLREQVGTEGFFDHPNYRDQAIAWDSVFTALFAGVGKEPRGGTGAECAINEIVRLQKFEATIGSCDPSSVRDQAKAWEAVVKVMGERTNRRWCEGAGHGTACAVKELERLYGIESRAVLHRCPTATDGARTLFENAATMLGFRNFTRFGYGDHEYMNKEVHSAWLRFQAQKVSA